MNKPLSPTLQAAASAANLDVRIDDLDGQYFVVVGGAISPWLRKQAIELLGAQFLLDQLWIKPGCEERLTTLLQAMLQLKDSGASIPKGSSFGKSIQEKRTIDEMVFNRNMAIMTLARSLEILSESHYAGESLKSYLNSRAYTLPTGEAHGDFSKLVKDIDQRFWRDAIKTARLQEFMSRSRYESLYYSIERDAPPFEADAVRATLGTHLERLRDYQAEAVVEIFKNMNIGFVCNDGFKIRRLLRLDVGGLGCHPWRNSMFGTSIYAHNCPLHYLDVELHKIAGDEEVPTLQTSKFNNRVLGQTIETKYFTVVTYLKGSAKVTFNESGEKLLPHLNAQIAHHFGSTLPKTA